MSAERIRRVISEAKPGTIPDEMLAWVSGPPCDGSKFHSPTPLIVREYYLSDVVFTMKDNTSLHEDPVHLCATCSDNMDVYLSILYAYDGVMPTLSRRDFGNTIRDLGDRAWAHHLKRA
jgi:hypothetical protein